MGRHPNIGEWHPREIGAWVAHLYIDTQTSMAMGRQELMLFPVRVREFSRSASGHERDTGHLMTKADFN
jgi:hypothetical protein